MGSTSGWSGTLLVTRDASIILADSRYTERLTVGPDDHLSDTVRTQLVSIGTGLIKNLSENLDEGEGEDVEEPASV